MSTSVLFALVVLECFLAVPLVANKLQDKKRHDEWLNGTPEYRKAHAALIARHLNRS